MIRQIVKRRLQKRFRKIWKDKLWKDGCSKDLGRSEKMAAENIYKGLKRQDETAALPAGYHDRWSNLTKQNNGLCAWIGSGDNIVILNLAGGSKLDIYCRLFLIFLELSNFCVIVNLVCRQFVMFQMWNIEAIRNWFADCLHTVSISPLFMIQIEYVCHYMTCPRVYAQCAS